MRRKQPTCESCGREADVRLRDGSLWCAGCDIAARDLGYDNQPAQWLHVGIVRRAWRAVGAYIARGYAEQGRIMAWRRGQ